MSIELPKDAEGREIPLDTKVLYDSDGIEFFTDRSMYMRVTDEWWFFGHFGSSTSKHRIAATKLYLTSPDSWEKLEEDLDRAIGTPRPDNFDSMTCGYFNSVGKNCQECKKRNGFDSSYCNKVAWKNILSRIRKLRGEGE